MIKRKETITKSSGKFNNELNDLIKKAKEYSLIGSALDFETSINQLKNEINRVTSQETSDKFRTELEQEYYLTQRKIKNLKIFSNEYKLFKKNLINTEDSLKPIKYLKEQNENNIKTSVFEELVNSFSDELVRVKKARKDKTPIDKQVDDTIQTYEKRLALLQDELSILPNRAESFDNDKEKYMFLGEIKSKLELFSDDEGSLNQDTESKIKDLESQISLISVEDTTEKKELTIKVVEEIITDYIELAEAALENYALYKPVFDYKHKSLRLRKPKTSFIENVGSSSNHMFLHLFFSLAMQEVSFKNNSPFIAPYLIIDQPSRPYYGDETGRKRKDIKKSDQFKITKAFELLDIFIKERLKNNSNFQMIVFEHVPKTIIEGFENVHIVEEFWDGNALIPTAMIK